MENNIRFDRLEELAEHLIHGKLGHEVFSFVCYNSGGESVEGKCGTSGCAIGELPIISKDWMFGMFGTPTLKKYENLVGTIPTDEVVDKSAKEYFGLTEAQVYQLFYPWNSVSDFDGEHLDGQATKEQVGYNILKFINYHKQEGDANES